MKSLRDVYASVQLSFFFFNDTATTEIYTLSLHDALPISGRSPACAACPACRAPSPRHGPRSEEDTSELQSRFGISYAVFCLKKKNGSKLRSDGKFVQHSSAGRLGPPPC